LAAVRGLDEAGRVAGVGSVEALARPGTELGGLESSDSRVACARASGDSAEQAVTAARQALAALTYVVDHDGLPVDHRYV
jgi:hypothetical protein